MTTFQSTTLENNYSRILDQIFEKQKNLNNRQPITLIAVSKKQSIDAIETLYKLGHRDFGENYAQELLTKANELNRRGYSDIRWHFIGHLQTNKVKTVLPYIYALHTLDSERLTLEIVKYWSKLSKKRKIPVFLEVNIDREESKSGMFPENISAFSNYCNQFPELEILGLMSIPSAREDRSSSFIRLRELEKTCRPNTSGMLSMGMSDDFLIAIQEGATHIRVGSALFGPRG